jgi:transmembrane sensor
MTTQEFQALLLKYRSGKCTIQENAKIHLWYNSLNQEVTCHLDDPEKQLLEDRMLRHLWQKIKELNLSELSSDHGEFS